MGVSEVPMDAYLQRVEDQVDRDLDLTYRPCVAPPALAKLLRRLHIC